MQAWQWWPVHQLGHAHRDPLFNACHAQNAVPADIGGAALLQRLPDRATVHDAGLAVLADMLITTHFMTLVMLTIWRLPLVLVVAFYFVFTPIEATYWSSTLEKVPTGAPPPPPPHLCMPMNHMALRLLVTASCRSPLLPAQVSPSRRVVAQHPSSLMLTMLLACK